MLNKNCEHIEVFALIKLAEMFCGLPSGILICIYLLVLSIYLT